MKTGFWLLGLAFVSNGSIADETSSHRVYAKPVERTPPTYPSSELRNGQQGWVELSYVVTEDGSVVEPVVEASSGSRAFERAAINTVKRWQYEPALLDGEPVQQCKTKVRISFAIDGTETHVSRKFHRSYRKISEAIDRAEIESAARQLDEAFEAKGLTLGELSWLWALKARVAGLRGDKDGQLVAVRRAAAAPGNLIPDNLRSGLLTTQVVLELQANNLAAALDAWLKLKAMDAADTSRLDPIIEDIQVLVGSDQLLVSAAQIGGDGNCETCSSQWRYRPMRRALEITEIDGTLGNLELRCEWQRYVDEARENVAWKIPASWGDCTVVVHGEPGATFKLVELPDA